MSKLTPRQQQVLDFIHEYMAANAMPPTRAEIARELGFRSANAAEEHLRALARKGAIEMIKGASRGIRLPQTPEEPEEVRPVSEGLPVIGHVAAGSPILASEHVESRCPVQRDFFSPPADFMLHVRGTSMIDIGVFDDDLVAVASTPEARNGDIVVARVNDDVTLKRYFHEGDHIRLVAENPEFDDIIVTKGDVFAIEGRYVGVIRRTLH